MHVFYFHKAIDVINKKAILVHLRVAPQHWKFVLPLAASLPLKSVDNLAICAAPSTLALQKHWLKWSSKQNRDLQRGLYFLTYSNTNFSSPLFPNAQKSVKSETWEPHVILVEPVCRLLTAVLGTSWEQCGDVSYFYYFVLPSGIIIIQGATVNFQDPTMWPLPRNVSHL